MTLACPAHGISWDTGNADQTERVHWLIRTKQGKDCDIVSTLLTVQECNTELKEDQSSFNPSSHREQIFLVLKSEVRGVRISPLKNGRSVCQMSQQRSFCWQECERKLSPVL